MARYYLEHYGFVGEDEPYLAHHGIEGMRWGKRNGPPYPLSDAKHNTVLKKAKDKWAYHKASQKRNKKWLKDLHNTKKTYKNSAEDPNTILRAKEYGWEPDNDHPSSRGFFRKEKVGDIEDFEFRIWENASSKYDFHKIETILKKYIPNNDKARSLAIKSAKAAGIYEDLLDNDNTPGKISWDDSAFINQGRVNNTDDGGDGVVDITCWAMGDHIQTFHYYVKNGKIEIGPMDG